MIAAFLTPSLTRGMLGYLRGAKNPKIMPENGTDFK
jgi:hypothetical protein